MLGTSFFFSATTYARLRFAFFLCAGRDDNLRKAAQEGEARREHTLLVLEWMSSSLFGCVRTGDVEACRAIVAEQGVAALNARFVLSFFYVI